MLGAGDWLLYARRILFLPVRRRDIVVSARCNRAALEFLIESCTDFPEVIPGPELSGYLQAQEVIDRRELPHLYAEACGEVVGKAVKDGLERLFTWSLHLEYFETTQKRSRQLPDLVCSEDPM